MAFGAQQLYPNDLRPRVGIGCNLPFSEGGVFTPNFTTQEAIKYNLINYFLTNPGERPGNPNFGGGLRNFVFSQITQGNLEFLRDDIQTKIKEEFPEISVSTVEVNSIPDDNAVSVNIGYFVENTTIEDEVTLNFS